MAFMLGVGISRVGGWLFQFQDAGFEHSQSVLDLLLQKPVRFAVCFLLSRALLWSEDSSGRPRLFYAATTLVTTTTSATAHYLSQLEACERHAAEIQEFVRTRRKEDKGTKYKDGATTREQGSST